MSALTKFVGDETGVTAIEYGLMAGLIAIAIIPGLYYLGARIFWRFLRLWFAIRFGF